MNLRVLVPVALVVAAYVVFCAHDIFTQAETRYLPKPVWLVVCLISIPLGGILYYLLGHTPQTKQAKRHG